MALTRITSGGIAEGVKIIFDSENNPTSPAISFQDNTGTGIYHDPSTNSINVATGGQKRLSISSSGVLGLSSGTFLPVTNSSAPGAKNIALYVNQSDINASDAADNDGTNINRPYKTIERALLEAARRSYVTSTVTDDDGTTIGNDKFEAFTVLVMPGEYNIDNRPGYDQLTNPINSDDFETNIWRFNPRNGGVIIPRGTSIIGYDLRKTVIRPKYIPSPFTDTGANTGDTYAVAQIMFDAANMIQKNRGFIQEQTRLYLEQSTDSLAGSTVSALYGNLSTTKKAYCVRDLGYLIDGIVDDLRNGGNASSYNVGQFYTNGVNNINLTGNEKDLTIAAFQYARNIAINALNNWPGTQPVGFTYTLRSGSIARTFFTAGTDYTVGNCVDANSAVNQLVAVVTTIINNPSNYSSTVKKTLGVYEPTAIFKVTGGCYFWQMTFKDAKATSGTLGSYAGNFKSVSFSGGVPTFGALDQSDYDSNGNVTYSHHRVIAFTYADQRTSEGELETYYSKIDNWDATYDSGLSREARIEEYRIVGDASKRTRIDTVNSASPYIFNCSLRSVYGLNGMWADGSKVQPDSFKSMVVAQFTGISLQKDASCFWQPKTVDGIPTSGTNPTDFPIYADPDAEYKANCRHFHIKASSGAFIQVVSVFAVGYADQFLAESGGDMSITNSNSNFGQISLRAVGHQFKSFDPASQGKITALIPPKGIDSTLQTFEISGIDARTTWEKNGYPVDPTLNFVEFSAEQKNNFVYNEQTSFKLYLDIASINTENDIPELEISAKDNYLSTGNYTTKRYLLYGASNLALFRDYYSVTGTVKQENAKIQVIVDNESGGQSTYTATVKLTNGESGTKNAERQGYFYDDGGIYIILDNRYDNTKSFIANFLFKTTTKNIFKTTTRTLQDGSVEVVSGPTTTTVLEYSTSFPAPIVTRKYVDSRGSNPNDLIWRIEYTIPKDCATTPKPPEKRFVIKGTRSSNGLDGVPYVDYRFSVLDVEEVQAWVKNSKDGIYYLTVIRADVDKFINWHEGTYLNKAINLTRGTYSKYDNLSEFNNNNINFRASTNINYLYPSINEEGLEHTVRQIWNPPQMDSRVLVEAIGSGFRPKDLSVPNKYEYVSKISNIVSITPANPTHERFQISSLSESSGTITITTIGNHNYTAGDVVYILGTNSNGDGYRTVLSTPTSTTFTYYQDEFQSGSFASGAATSEKIQTTVVVSGNITDKIFSGATVQISGNSGDNINNIFGIYDVSVTGGNTQFKINITDPSRYIPKTVRGGYIEGGVYKLYVTDTSKLRAGQYIRAAAGLTNTAKIASISGNVVSLVSGSNASTFTSAFDATTDVTVNFLELGSDGYIHIKPFYEVPSMLSVTAEAVHRLVEALDLRYLRIDKTNTSVLNSGDRVNVAPVVAWDDRGYSTWSGLPVYGYGKSLIGSRTKSSVLSLTNLYSSNAFGINDGTDNRRIPVIALQTQSFGSVGSTSLSDLISKCVDLPLYRPSILRASSHTWEYIGLGSGNYSTGFPNLQTRVLKPYEQFILQSYENGGGFVASTGTNSNGDQYVGNQVVQAGGQSTFTLNVPKIRKSSESNFLEVIVYTDSNADNTVDSVDQNVENRIANSVINVTSAEKKNSVAQTFLKGLSNFFTTSKLSVTDRANIQSLFVNDTFAIANSKITNGDKFPEGGPDGYGFTKAAKPEKTGFISTDTNDRLYVSPKFLDAWRLKRQLLSATNINLDNNRIYVSSLNRTALNIPTGTAASVGLDTTSTQIKVFDTVGLPTNGKLDIEMTLKAVSQDIYRLSGTTKLYFNPVVSITLDYSSVDYTNNIVYLNTNQNKLGANSLSSYISNILPNSTYKEIVKNWPSPLDNTGGIVNDSVLSDTRYLSGTTTSAFDPTQTVSVNSVLTIPVNTSGDFYNQLPSRGAVILRHKSNSTVYYTTYAYYKDSGIKAITKSSFTNDQGLTSYPSGTPIFFAGCSTSVSFADRWAAEGPFIPSADQITEDVDLESATLFTPYEKPIPFTDPITDDYINNNVPNPISSKALGINLQTRQAIKKFSPLTSFKQLSDYCSKAGFTSADSVELLFKPGYYKLNDQRAGLKPTFIPKIKINGSGVSRTGGNYGKEVANVSAGRIGGYTNTLTKRGDSVNFFKTIYYSNQYVSRTDRLYITTEGNPIFNGGCEISNVNFLGLNEAITVNEILDSTYSGDPLIQKARRDVRKAWYVKQQSSFPTNGKLSFSANTTSSDGKALITFRTKNDAVLNSSGDVNTANSSNARFIEFTFVSTNFTGTSGTPSNAKKFEWMRDYVIPGTTIYYGSNETPSKVLSRIYSKNDSTGVETIRYSVALYISATDSTQSSVEDLDIGTFSDGTDYTISFCNIDGDEFATLVYNLGIYIRTQFMPASMTLNGQNDKYGYDEQVYDTPEVFGIVGGYRRGTLNLVIDSNPTQPLDVGISSFNIILNAAATAGTNTISISSTDANINNLRVGQQVSGSGIGYKALIASISTSGSNTIIILKDAKGNNINHTELIASGISLTVTPKAIYPFARNFGGYGAIQMAYKTNQNEETAPSFIYFPNGFKALFGKATTRFYLVEFLVEDIANFNDNYNLGILDKIRNIDINTTNIDLTTDFASDEAFIVSAKNNLNLLVDGDNPYRLTEKSTNTIDTTTSGIINALKIRGKQVAINWPHSYKSMRRSIATAHAPSIGNLSTQYFEVSAVPGSNVPLSVTNTTFGPLSPFNRQNNTYGGGYFGGLIKTRGAAVTFYGNRIRGNVVTNWSSLLFLGGEAYNTVSRTIPSASRLNETQRFTYGHSVDFIQHEESNNIANLPYFQPAKLLTVGKNDEMFKYVTEYTPEGLNFLEPNFSADNKKVDYDSRVFPISTIQRIPRQVSGTLQTTINLQETGLTANAIEFGSTTTGKSGWNLRYNDTTSSIAAGGSDGAKTLTKNTLQFNYTDDTVVTQIFPNFTKIVKSDNITTVYATVTKVELTTTNGVKFATIEYDGFINYNGYSSTTPEGVASSQLSTLFAEMSLKFSTQFINSVDRYIYTGGATSRYYKGVANSASSYLVLSSDNNTVVQAEHADIVPTKIGNGVASVSYDVTRTLTNTRSGTTPMTVRMSTDSLGNITYMTILSMGSGHLAGDTLLITGVGDGINGYTFRVNRSLTDDISLFESGEYIVVAPRNCFILNNLNAGSLSGLKAQLQRSKMTYKPGSYINYVGGAIYYKIATSATTKPYIGIMRYVNPNNKTDIRTAIVINLEEATASPVYQANQRFDLYDRENTLDYWPSSGRVTIGDLETCDYTLTNTSGVYTLTLNRSNTKYFPSYMHDWEGLDITDSSNANVTVGDLQPIQIRLADPVDISANTFKRILPTANNATSGLYNLQLTQSFMTPYADYTNNISVLEVPSGDVDQDFEKYDVGQIVTIPYRNLIYRDGYGDANYYGGYGPYSNITFEVTSAANAGDREIIGKISANATTPYNMAIQVGATNTNGNRVDNADNSMIVPWHHFQTGDVVRLTTTGTLPGGLALNTDYYIILVDGWRFAFATSAANAQLGTRIDLTDNGTGTHTVTPTKLRVFWNLAWQPHMVTSETAVDTTIFNSLNPLSTFRSKQYIDYITVGTDTTGVTLYFDQALIGNISSGTKFKMVPGFTQERFHMAGIFKSRIIDIAKDTNKIKLYLADKLPYELTSDSSNTARHFGFFNINNGGWSFPRQNFSAFRTNNIRVGTGKYEIILPNRSGRIQKGDLLSYSYESTISSKTTIATDTPKNQSYVILQNASDLSVGNQISNYLRLDIPTIATNATSITIAGHGLQTGDEVTYVAGRNSSDVVETITGLTHKSSYYVRVTSVNSFELYNDLTAAYNQTTANRITFTAGNTLTNQRLLRNAISSSELYVDMTNSSVFNPTTGLFTIANHGLTNKEAVTFRRLQTKTGHTAVKDGTTFYAYVEFTDPNKFYLRESLDNWPTATGNVSAGASGAVTATILQFTSALPDYALLDVKTIIREIQSQYVYLGRFNENDTSGSGQITPTNTIANIGRRSPITITGSADIRKVSSSVVSVGTADADGYSTITLDTADNILYNGHPTIQDYLSVSDIIVVHVSDRLKYGGPTLNTFLYSRNGAKLGFSDFGINNTWFGNYFGIAKGWGPYGRLGWTGNFGARIDGSKVIGSGAKGSLELSWNKQRNNSIWAVSSPVRPAWSLWQWDWARQVSFLQPIVAEYHSVGYDLTYNRWYRIANLERDGWTYVDPIKHLGRDATKIYSSFNTNINRNRREGWGGPGYWRGGIGAYDVQNYKFPMPSTLTNQWTPRGGDEEIKSRITLGYEVQDFEIYTSGWPNWGKGNRTVATEQIKIKYVQHYRPCLTPNTLTTSDAYATKYGANTDKSVNVLALGQTVQFADETTKIGRKFIKFSSTSIDMWQYLDAGCAIYDSSNNFVGHFADWYWGKPYGLPNTTTEGLFIELLESNTALSSWSTTEFRIINPAAPVVLSTWNPSEMDLDVTTTTGSKNGGKVYVSATSGGSATTAYVLPSNQQNIIGRNSYNASTHAETGGIPFSRHYNMAFNIESRGYNNTSQLSTEGISLPVARNWLANRIVKLRLGDLSNFEWSPMNLLVTKYNRKIHNSESVIANSNNSDLGVNTTYI